MPERKAVLLLGDSIRVGYAETVKEALSDIADVFYPLGNGRNTQYLMTGLYTWSSLCNPEAVDLIHFNCGHWDAAHWNRDPLPLTPIPAYAENLRRIVWAMRKLFPHAKITFAASTPMCPGKEDPLNPRTNEELRAYNEAAREALRDLDVPIDDLWAAASGFSEDAYADFCHFTPKGFRQLGIAAAAFIRKKLSE